MKIETALAITLAYKSLTNNKPRQKLFSQAQGVIWDHAEAYRIAEATRADIANGIMKDADGSGVSWNWDRARNLQAVLNHARVALEVANHKIAQLETQVAAQDARNRELIAVADDQSARLMAAEARVHQQTEVISDLDIQIARHKGLLREIVHWLSSKCPCADDKPDPCPLCGAKVESSDRCCVFENTVPRALWCKITEAMKS